MTTNPTEGVAGDVASAATDANTEMQTNPGRFAAKSVIQGAKDFVADPEFDKDRKDLLVNAATGAAIATMCLPAGMAYAATTASVPVAERLAAKQLRERDASCPEERQYLDQEAAAMYQDAAFLKSFSLPSMLRRLKSGISLNGDRQVEARDQSECLDEEVYRSIPALNELANSAMKVGNMLSRDGREALFFESAKDPELRSLTVEGTLVSRHDMETAQPDVEWMNGIQPAARKSFETPNSDDWIPTPGNAG